MTRPIQLFDKPPMTPFVCAKCGSQEREHFVDLGIDSELRRNDEHGQTHYTEGVIYFCSRCMVSLLRDYTGALFDFLSAQEESKKMDWQGSKNEIMTLQNEIYSLHKILQLKDEEIEKRDATIAGLPKVAPVGSATKVIEDLLGEDVNGTDAPDVTESGDDSAGDDPEPESDDLHSESSPESTIDLNLERSIFA